MDFRFNSLIPEFSASDFARSLAFYTAILGFKIEYQRPENKFAFLSYQGNQIMLEQAHDNWQTGDLTYPFGRGINFEMSVADLHPLLSSLQQHAYPLMVEPQERWYRMGDQFVGQRQFLVQDPDGYLLRFAQKLDQKPLQL